jgi:hypothetical protein
MFTLYMKWEAGSDLAPADIPFNLTPRDVLEMAGVFSELDYLKYAPQTRNAGRHAFASIPRRRASSIHLNRFASATIQTPQAPRNNDGLHPPEVKWHLEQAWMVGVNTRSKRDRLP